MFSKGKSKGKKAKEPKRKVAPPTMISTDLTISGNLSSEGEIQVDGVVDGDVDSARLSIGETGKVNGSVKAERALVRGRVNGQIRAREVTLTRTAQVKGDVYHETLSIEPGAKIDGHCRRLNSVDDADQEGININLVVSDGLPTGHRS